MAKTSKPLYGSSKDAYFKRLLRAEPGIGAAASERILRRISAEVVQVRLRSASVDDEVERAVAAEEEAVSASGGRPPAELPSAATVARTAGGAHGAVPDAEDVPSTVFDPYSPNVIVVVRRDGRERALAALAAIERVENLRALAREQQLSIDSGLETPSEIRAAIVLAAERRIANRRAAAG